MSRPSESLCATPPAPQGPARSPAWLAWAMLAGIASIFAMTRLASVGIPSQREYDEGVYLLSARAMLAGEKLFADVFSSQPPAFLETLAMTMRIAGDSLTTARLLIFACALLALLAVAGIAARMFGSWAAPVAAAALALATTFFDLAHVVEAELPAIAYAMLALLACLQARHADWSRRWLVAAGALLGLATLFKLFVAPYAVPLALLLLLAPGAGDATTWKLDGSRSQPFQRATARGLLVAAGALAVLSVPLLLYDPAELWQQTIGFHLSKYGSFVLDRGLILERIQRQLGFNASIAAVATTGVALLLLEGRLAAAWLAAWFATVVAVLLQQTPLFWRHFVLLYPPLALAVSALALPSRKQAWPLAAMSVAAVIAVSATSAVVIRQPGRLFFPWPYVQDEVDKGEALLESARFIRNRTSELELVAGDDPITIYLADRRVPGAICDTSQARVVARSLTLADAVRHSRTARLLVLRRDGRLSKLGGYTAWVKANYELEKNVPRAAGVRRTYWVRKTPLPAERASRP